VKNTAIRPRDSHHGPPFPKPKPFFKRPDLDRPLHLDLGSFISAVIYFNHFHGRRYFVIVVPSKFIMARQGKVVFGDPPATKTCPPCLSDDLSPAASKCEHCGSPVNV
jgi:hypothetical protein